MQRCEDFETFSSLAQLVIDAMVAEYKVPMVLDQATISNTNQFGHPPHADNLRFDSVWKNGQRVRGELEAARRGADVLWKAEKTSYKSYSCSVALSDPDGCLARLSPRLAPGREVTRVVSFNSSIIGDQRWLRATNAP